MKTLHITITEEARGRLTGLQRMTGQKEAAKVIGKALSLYDTLLEQYQMGGTILVRDAQGVFHEVNVSSVFPTKRPR